MSSSSLSRRLAHLAIAPHTASSSRSISTSVPRLAEASTSTPSSSSSSAPSLRSDRPQRSAGGAGRGRTGDSSRGGPGGGDRGSRQGGSGGGGRTRRPPPNRSLPPFPEWFAKQGREQYATATGKGPFWIGNTPFPLNPSFNPPAPVAQKVRDEMWKMHTENPRRWTVRNLSGLFGQTMERTQAILRLKALEGELQRQSVPLQTSFQSNMERLLGSEVNLPRPSQDPKRPDDLQRPYGGSEASPAAPRVGVANLEARGPLAEEVREEDARAQAAVAGGEEGGVELSQSALGEELQAQKEENLRRLTLLPSGEPDRKLRTSGAAASYLGAGAELKPERTALRIVDLGAKAKDPETSVYAKTGTMKKNRRKAANRKRATEKKRVLREAATAAGAGTSGTVGAGAGSTPRKSSL